MRGVPPRQTLADVLAYRGMLREFGQCGRNAIADQRLTTLHIEPAQQPDEWPVRASDDRVLKHRRTRRKHAGAQRSGVHPRAGHQLEILSEAAVEDDAA